MCSPKENFHAEHVYVRVCRVFLCCGTLQPGLRGVTRDDVLDSSVFALVDVAAVFHLFPPQLLDQLLLLPLVLM